MTTSLKDLLAQRAALNEQIAKARDEERSGALDKIRELMHDYEISIDEIGVKKARKISVATVKYRDPSSGKTWSGRGKPPAWIAGQNREKFLIAD